MSIYPQFHLPTPKSRDFMLGITYVRNSQFGLAVGFS